ncbi:type II secretion system minor pseudopilin GspH [Paraferrimonas haliotis]|uniref:Type II secretion system protein H n=1 Tax=Paraferrimonas haliotis TaxID=2013866 RepID=A0AA37TVI8_9GAMM|nr:type II secretion system minor pseudopilin GspH [Paraferrimonas haliotis]GLS83470.1 type II secretion system protein GspH [Paraferrimonas haliotis]
MIRRRQSGFTLLEVMLVVLLIGMSAAAVVLSMSTNSVEDELKKQAQKFMAVTEIALQEATLSGRFAGILVEDNSYSFLVYDDEVRRATETDEQKKQRRLNQSNLPKWLALSGRRGFERQTMAQGIDLELTIDGLPLDQEEDGGESWFDDDFIEATNANKHPEPQLLLFPSGEMTAFELIFASKNDKGEDVIVEVIGDPLGRMHIVGEEPEDEQ